MARDVITLLDHLELDRVAICGVSFGGVLAQQVATSYSARIAQLVIADSRQRGRAGCDGLQVCPP